MLGLAAINSTILGLWKSSLHNTRKLFINNNADCSRLSFSRLSFALYIMGIFWLLVILHEYVVWLRNRQRALFLVAVIVSCIAIQANELIQSDLRTNRHLQKIYWSSVILFLTILTIYITYLITGEPSPISLQLQEVPSPQSLKFESISLMFIVLAPFGAALAGVRIDKICRRIPLYIIIFCTACLLGRFILFFYYSCVATLPWGATFSRTNVLLQCHGSPVQDIGGTTLNAIHAIQKGLNPYTIDVQGSYTNVPERGYTYWPMMFAIYMPIASFFPTGWGAIRLTNFFLDIISAALVFVVVCRRSGWLSGVLAVSLYLMLPLLPWRAYLWGDTDLVPTVLLLAALALYQTRPGLAGLMVGLSVSAKFIPGLLMLVCCLPEFRRSRYITGFVLGLAPAAAFFLLAPWDFLHNTMWMLASKSSWLYEASFYVFITTRIAFISLMIVVSFLIISRPPDLFARCTLYIICVAGIMLTGGYHNNYAMWWLPFFCILLSSALSRILFAPHRVVRSGGIA